jgi:hypothetical protein
MGIFNLFIDPTPPQIYSCHAVADENAMRNDSRLHYREFHEEPFLGRIPAHLAVRATEDTGLKRAAQFTPGFRSQTAERSRPTTRRQTNTPKSAQRPTRTQVNSAKKVWSGEETQLIEAHEMVGLADEIGAIRELELAGTDSFVGRSEG